MIGNKVIGNKVIGNKVYGNKVYGNKVNLFFRGVVSTRKDLPTCKMLSTGKAQREDIWRRSKK